MLVVFRAEYRLGPIRRRTGEWHRRRDPSTHLRRREGSGRIGSLLQWKSEPSHQIPIREELVASPIDPLTCELTYLPIEAVRVRPKPTEVLPYLAERSIDLASDLLRLQIGAGDAEHQ